MDFKEYSDKALDFLNPAIFNRWEDRMTLGALGISGEAGEVSDYWKKVHYHKHELDIEHMIKELGDVLWYINLLACSCGRTLEDVAQANLSKLGKRYEGGFSIDKSINRAPDDD